MALTNFARMTSEQKTAWSMSLWKAARNWSFLTRYLGTGPDAMIQRVTELKASEKGTRAVITLVADALGDGVAGDRTLKGNEEALRSYDQVIRVDQLRHAHKHEGRMAEQKSIVSFRKEARDILGYWLADRIDQLAMLTLSGVAYTYKPDGTTRVGSDLPYLEFAADITAPSTNRYLVWDKTGFGVNSATSSLASDDLPTWGMFVDLKAILQERYVRPIRGSEGLEVFNVFMSPRGIAALKKDTNFLSAWKESMPRTPDHPIFKGGDVIYVDGFAIRPSRHVYSPSTWGGGSQKGQRILVCGAQALAYADLGTPYWVEEDDDYENQQAISVGKIIGFKKPVFRSDVSGTNEDFGVVCVDTAV
jgi:N4-gp56 family major capsid protein